MVVHGDKVVQLTVHGGKVPMRYGLWGQKVVSPNNYQAACRSFMVKGESNKNSIKKS
jgi:hypothetical protein